MKETNTMQDLHIAIGNGGYDHQQPLPLPDFDLLLSPHDGDLLDQILSPIPSSSSWNDFPNSHPHWEPSPHSLSPLPLSTIEDQSSAHMASDQSIMLQQQLLSRAAAGHLNFTHEISLPMNTSNYEAAGIYNGMPGTLPQLPSQLPHIHHFPINNDPQLYQSYGAPQVAPVNHPSPGGAPPVQPKQPRVRARRGQATDPHSIAERLRRERIADGMKSLQELVPNANKTDKASMLDEIIEYVKFLQLQVKVLSVSRLGGSPPAPPLLALMSSEETGGSNGSTPITKRPPAANGDTMRLTEQQVAKLMEDDMGTAMQYLQGKGLCLIPISFASAISAAARNNPTAVSGDCSVSPTMPGTAASATAGGGTVDEGPSSAASTVLQFKEEK